MTSREAVKYARERQGVKDGKFSLMLGNFIFLSDGGEVHETTEVYGPIEVHMFDTEEEAEDFGEDGIAIKGFDAWFIPEISTSHIRGGIS